MSGGKPTSIIITVTSMYQTNSGIRSSDMPAVRRLRIETAISTAAQIAEISTKVTPSSQTSALTPGVNGRLDSGVYMNQPLSGASPSASAPIRIEPPNR